MAKSLLHWPNVPELRDETCRIFEAGQFQGAVILSHCGGLWAPTDPAIHRFVRERVGAEGLVIERLFWPMGNLPSLDRLVGLLLDRIGLAGTWCNHWQILNETDLEYPQASPEQVAQLLWEVQRIVKGAGADWVHLGWPTPQVPGAVSYFAAQVPQAAHYDFLADRSYWQPAEAMEWPNFGRKYRQHRAYIEEYCKEHFLSTPATILTEYGCSAPLTPKEEKAAQYRQFVLSLSGEDWVVGAAAFIGAGGTYDWDSEAAGGLWVTEEMAKIMADTGSVQNPVDWYSLIEPYLHEIWAATRSERVRAAVVAIKHLAGLD